MEEQIHTTNSIAETLGVGARRIRTICNRLIRRKGHYRLTDAEYEKVVSYYHRCKRQRSPRKI